MQSHIAILSAVMFAAALGLYVLHERNAEKDAGARKCLTASVSAYHVSPSYSPELGFRLAGVA
jgi:hypothetical protein